MNADTALKELGVEAVDEGGLREVDEPSSTQLAERHRRKLAVHGRMLGSFEDAEGAVRSRSSVRAILDWNSACHDELLSSIHR